MRSYFVFVITLGTCGFALAPARAQCLQWSPEFQNPGINDRVRDMVVFDDGNGPSIFACGFFATAGGARANAIARFDGAQWHAVGAGVGPFSANTGISSMGVFDDGSGAQLYASGDFTTPWSRIARWDGATWNPVGTGLGNNAGGMLSFDDGSGPALYVSGNLGTAGGIPVHGIARWNGSVWQDVDGGLTFGIFTSLTAYDDGSGPVLYANNVSVTGHVMRWNGSTWTVVGGGVNNLVSGLAVVDHGSGPLLYAVGRFTLAGGVPVDGIATWDGSAWSAALAPPPISPDDALDIWSITTAGGEFLYAEADEEGGYDKRFQRFDGTTWTPITDDIGSDGDTGILDIVAFDDGSGGGLEAYIAGKFTHIGGGAAPNIARYDGSTWSQLAPADGVTDAVYSSLVFDDGSGRALYVGGELYTAGDKVVRGVARRGASGWSDVGGGMSTSGGGRGTVYALAIYDDGSGEALYAGGNFVTAGGNNAQHIARWDGTSWSNLGSGPGGTVRALAVYDSGEGPRLYAGGQFPSNGNILRWSGTSWQSLETGVDSTVNALKVFDAGTGAALWVGGPFLTAGGQNIHKIATWNGAWASTNFSLTSGGEVRALEVFSGPSGVPTIYAAGSLNFGFMQWNGAGWTNIAPPGGLNPTYALRTFDDGSGNGLALYAGGDFTPPSSTYQKLAKWDGSTWSDVGGGFEDVLFNGPVYSLCPYDDDGDGRADLIAGGAFVATSTSVSSAIAKWTGCAGPGTPYCFADGSLATDCPCAAPHVVPHPSGSAFGGCANAFNPHGAGLSAIGAINPDTVTLFAHGMSPSGYMMFFKASVSNPTGAVASDGVSCASSSGALIRFGAQNAVNGSAQYPNPPLGHTIPLSIRGATPVGSGLTGYYQAVYRHTTPNFCTADTLNFTSSYRVTWN